MGVLAAPTKAASEFTRGSSYVLVGRRYAELLEKGGKPIDATKVRGAIREVLEK